MLTLVINPGGQPRVVTIAEAFRRLGVNINGQAVQRTPEERRQRRKETILQYQQRKLERERGRE